MQTQNFLPPRSTYFRTSDVRPYFEKGILHIANGTSYQASWGSTNVSSTIEQLSNDIIMVNVVGWHKHTISPVGGNFYFVNLNGQWTRKTANAKIIKKALGKQ